MKLEVSKEEIEDMIKFMRREYVSDDELHEDVHTRGLSLSFQEYLAMFLIMYRRSKINTNI